MDVKDAASHYSIERAKYQKTDGGLIPADWRYTRLTEVARLESGHTPSRRKPSYWAGDIPWVSLHDTDSLGANEITQTAQMISAEGLQNSSARLLPKGTVVFSRTATVGKASIMGREMATSQDFANYICGPDVYNRYLVYLFRYMAPEWKKLMAGSIHNTVYMPAFRALKVVLPPRNEQQAIAEALSDADALIESLSLLLAKKRQIKQGVMQEVLTCKKRLTGFDGPWSEKRLSQLGEFLKGRGITRDQARSGTLPCVRYGEIYTCHGDVIHRYESWISPAVAATATPLRSGDVLFAGSGETKAEIGKCTAFISAEPAYAGGDIVILRTKNVSAAFLSHLLNTPPVQALKASRGQGDAVVHISSASLADIQVLMPDHDEQIAIAHVISELDEELDVLHGKLDKAREIKQGMMQALLTGRIRLMQPVSNVIPLPAKPAPTNLPRTQPSHNWQINEAVVIGVLAQRFGTEQFPLPRKRRVKLMYLLHRHAEGKAEGYRKQAAGPYDPNTKYKGPEQIALKNGYVRALHNGTYEGFVTGDKIEQAQRYFEQWYGPDALEWLERFRYLKTDELELLATVDMAMVDLAANGEPADLAGVKRIIAAHPEWVPKLSREVFSDDNIARTIAECVALFPA